MLTGSGAVPPTGVAACTVTPAPLMVVVLPAASVVTTLVNVGFSFMLTVTVVLPAASCSTRVNRLSLLVASVVLPATIANSLPNLCVTGLAPPAATGALALTLIPLSATLATAFNCATFTASVSWVPAARPVSCLVTVVPSPIETAACVDFQELVSNGETLVSATVPVTVLNPTTSLSVVAFEPLPNATAPAAVTVVLLPRATAPLTGAPPPLMLLGLANTVLAVPIVTLLPIIKASSVF